MLATPHSPAETALQQLAEQFTHWRQSRRTPYGPRIPEALWTEAVRLVQISTADARRQSAAPQAPRAQTPQWPRHDTSHATGPGPAVCRSLTGSAPRSHH